MNHQIETLNQGGVDLALHSWVPEDPGAVLYFIHGLQSHGGWFFETGPELAAMGVAFYALDRRGCGRSEGPRGDATSPDEWIADYLSGLLELRKRHPKLPITVAGQSAGGSIAAALACHPEAELDALLLCAPALGQRTARMSAARSQAAATSEPEARSPIPLEDSQYTRDPRYLDWMANDALMLRETTGRTQRCLSDLEKVYLDRVTESSPWQFPSGMVVPSEDSIIDLVISRDCYKQLCGDQGLLLQLPAADHYLEFSGARRQFWNFAANFAKTAGLTARSVR